MKKTIIHIFFLLGLVQVLKAQIQEIEEVLIIHHSHLDIGYTHLQPIMMENQKDYIDQALDMMDSTDAWPLISKPKWTCEVSEPVIDWLESAGKKDIARFTKYAQEGRIGISALQYNTTALATAESLIRQLMPARELEELMGIKVNTVNIHDITGIPWSATDLFKDCNIELLTMAINLHLSGTPTPRPAVYRWESPSGNELLVMNGEHYSMFDQWLHTSKMNLDTMQAGLEKYIKNIHTRNYPYNFVYLSATNAPFAYDNAPPNIDLPGLVKQWNEQGRKPRMRFVTPQDLLEKINELPRESFPVIKGDWTDFWNFGVASSAKETKINLNNEQQIRTIDILQAFGITDTRIEQLTQTAWDAINLYNEHTWGAWNTLERKNDFASAQWYIKAYPAYEGKALTKYVLNRQLHKFTGNAISCWKYEGVLVVNPSGSTLNYHIPIEDGWRKKNKHLASDLMTSEPFDKANQLSRLYGPVELKPYSWNFIPFDNLQAVDTTTLVRVGKGWIETPFYRLRFDSHTGKVISLFDRERKWEVLDTTSQWGFFQFVHEKPDPEEDSTRLSFHVRSVVNERIGLTGWKPDWKAVYSGLTGNVECEVVQNTLGATLIIRSRGEGVEELEQRITLRTDNNKIGLHAGFLKKDVWSPEGLYFAFPLNMDKGWKSYFDTGSIPVELDQEQIPGTCRDWVTVNSFVSIHEANRGVVLYCPDAPMIQVGNFNFGRNQTSIPKDKNPVLLAWPMNNYWETNYRASQPGYIELNYTFNTTNAYKPVEIMAQSQERLYNPVVFPVEKCQELQVGQFLNVEGNGIVVTAIKKAEDNKGIIVRLLNASSAQVSGKLNFEGRKIIGAWECTPQETNIKSLDSNQLYINFTLLPRKHSAIRISLSQWSPEN